MIGNHCRKCVLHVIDPDFPGTPFLIWIEIGIRAVESTRGPGHSSAVFPTFHLGFDQEANPLVDGMPKILPPDQGWLIENLVSGKQTFKPGGGGTGSAIRS